MQSRESDRQRGEGRREGAHPHDGDGGDGAPLAANPIAQVADGDLRHSTPVEGELIQSGGRRRSIRLVIFPSPLGRCNAVIPDHSMPYEQK